jgi:hypothetical protein
MKTKISHRGTEPQRTPCILFSLCLCVSVANVFAQDARQIVEESQKRSRSASMRYEGVLRVIDAAGKTAEKRWRYERLGAYGNSKAIIRFTAPAEVKGVALLVVNHPDRSSDQWMWTPAIGRDRRIAQQDRSTRFFGTDFSFEDLEERDVDQFDFSPLGEETVEGAPCWRIESKPKHSKSSQYSRSLIWIRKDHYVAARLESFVKEQLARRLEFKRTEDLQGIWTARTLDMHDLRRNSRTVLELEKVQYNVPLKDDDFTVQALRREQ